MFKSPLDTSLNLIVVATAIVMAAAGAILEVGTDDTPRPGASTSVTTIARQSNAVYVGTLPPVTVVIRRSAPVAAASGATEPRGPLEVAKSREITN